MEAAVEVEALRMKIYQGMSLNQLACRLTGRKGFFFFFCLFVFWDR
jgi:hypothetical protein